MTQVRARYYDGRTSAARDVDVEVFPRPDGRVRLVIHVASPQESLEYDDIRVESRVGQAARLFELPGGAMLEVPAEALDSTIEAPALRHGWVHALESRWSIVLVALAITVAIVWATMQYGVPVLAHEAVDAIPPDVDARVGVGGRALLAERVFQPSKVSAERQSVLQKEFIGVARDLGLGTRTR